jgi:putative Mg2+ transporter-C (MgtC) family protein
LSSRFWERIKATRNCSLSYKACRNFFSAGFVVGRILLDSFSLVKLFKNMNIEIIFQLFLSMILGALLGLEREYKGKEAGLQTYSLVALGACLFTMLSFEIAGYASGSVGTTFDHSRIIQAIAVGIGFLGAGVIFRQQSGVVGLTTAAGLWITAAVGIAVGIKLYYLATFTVFLALLVLAGLGRLEHRFFRKNQ